MQGFNKYYPPDFDPRQTQTLNDYRGVHALGKRAKDVDKGILVVRFELPFNIWCGSCNAHLGAGVRYNAQKKKVGNYYSTPIYGFRCKCHLCDGWFEIRTDPKNAQYVVESGARKQEAEWDPEENGGFAVHDNEAPTASEPPADPFLALEKTNQQKTLTQTKSQRFDELISLSSRATSDPYTLSQSLRKSFREGKKKDKEREERDQELRGRIGWMEGRVLGEEVEGEGREEWRRARERVASGTGSGSGTRYITPSSSAPTVTSARDKGRGKGKASEEEPRRMDLVQTLKNNTSRRLIGDAFSSIDPSIDMKHVRKATRGGGKIKDRERVCTTATIVLEKEKAKKTRVQEGIGCGGGLERALVGADMARSNGLRQVQGIAALGGYGSDDE